ncbi:MAG: hypothetical protein R3B13_20320 [Polyangiaceae bacterium]
MRVSWLVGFLGVVVACAQNSPNPDVSSGGQGANGAAGTQAGGSGGGGNGAGSSSGAGGAAGNGGAAGKGAGGSGGAKLCDPYTAPCASDEYCACYGVCLKRPTTCPTECSPVCGCDWGLYCNECIAHFYGDDVGGKPTSLCTEDGGGSAWDAGAPGFACKYPGQCQNGLKCCWVCDGSGSCSSKCTVPNVEGACPPL